MSQCFRFMSLLRGQLSALCCLKSHRSPRPFYVLFWSLILLRKSLQNFSFFAQMTHLPMNLMIFYDFIIFRNVTFSSFFNKLKFNFDNIYRMIRKFLLFVVYLLFTAHFFLKYALHQHLSGSFLLLPGYELLIHRRYSPAYFRYVSRFPQLCVPVLFNTAPLLLCFPLKNESNLKNSTDPYMIRRIAKIK